MNTQDILEIASEHLSTLSDSVFDVLSITKPSSSNAASNLSKVISKLSPLVGNLIEFNIVELLNQIEAFQSLGEWVRQDPNFPDTIFKSSIESIPGFEVKAWFPLATEITARFKESQTNFVEKNTHMVLLAWLPEYVIYGRPKVIGVSIIEAGSVANARDQHYHNPPDYLVIEPEDTKTRTRNLQQTTTSGYKWQDTQESFELARKVVDAWGMDGSIYSATPTYQQRLKQLMALYNYRLDTNFAKIDRIYHPEIESFKTTIYDMPYQGMTIKQWMKVCQQPDEITSQQAFHQHLGITG